MGCWTPFSHSHTHSLSHIYTHIHTHTHTHTPSLSALSAHFLSFFLFIFPPLLSPFSFLSFLSFLLSLSFVPFFRSFALSFTHSMFSLTRTLFPNLNAPFPAPCIDFPYISFHSFIHSFFLKEGAFLIRVIYCYPPSILQTCCILRCEVSFRKYIRAMWKRLGMRSLLPQALWFLPTQGSTSWRLLKRER